MVERATEPLFISDDAAVIRQALHVASVTSLTDLCGLLGFKTMEAQSFRDRCVELGESIGNA